MYSRISWHKHVSCAFSRLPFSLLNGRVAEPPRGRAHARHPRTTLYLLLPSPYFGSPLQSVHALPSPFFSLLTTLEAHCIVSTHYLLLSSPFSLLSCPLVSISGSIIIPFVYFVFFVVFPPPSSYSEDAWRNRRAGAPKRAIHALPSPFFSLLPTLEAHCKVTTHYLLLSSPFSLLSCPLVVQIVLYFSWFSWFNNSYFSWFNNSCPSVSISGLIIRIFSWFYAFISFYKNLAVTLSGARFTSSREPRATIRPPASPPPGPMSMM